MKNYIQYLYLLDLMANESNPVTKASDKEDRLYDAIQGSLTKEQFSMFEAFLEEYGDRRSEECGIYFEKGFRFAMRLMIECLNNDDVKESV